MNPFFSIVVSRQCTADDIRILRRFQCCAIDGSAHEWEIEPQRHINGLTKTEFAEPVRRLILTTETSAKVFAFAEYGYLEDSDVYVLAWVARSIDCAGEGLGKAILDIVLDDIAMDSCAMKRNNMVVAQISPDNLRSIALFSQAGFTDAGQDQHDSGFHIWSKLFTPHADKQVMYEFVTQDLLHVEHLAS